MELLFIRNQELLNNVSTTFVRSRMNDIPWQEARLIAIRGA